MDLNIISHTSVGPIVLGSSQEEVRAAVGREFRSFRKTPMSAMPTDNFVGQGIHVYYKKPGVCEAVEMFKPASPILATRPLMGALFSDMLVRFRAEDPEVEVNDSGLTSKRLGIGLFAPDHSDTPDARVQGVIVFERGYYDN